MFQKSKKIEFTCLKMMLIYILFYGRKKYSLKSKISKQNEIIDLKCTIC